MNPFASNFPKTKQLDCAQCDYVLLIDTSGSMSTRDMKGLPRWVVLKETVQALTEKVFEFDPDGIDVWAFSSTNTCYKNVGPEKVQQIFQEREPCGSTDMADVLKNALEAYFKKRDAGKSQSKGEMIFVITDGEPDDQHAVIDTIARASMRLQPQDNLALNFIQIGHDPVATQFLKTLDERLVSNGKTSYDFVKTIKIGDMERQGITQTILNLIHETARSKREAEEVAQT